MLDEREIVIRLVVAAAAGALLGFEREYHERPAGLRTHILVAVGACLFALAGTFGFGEFEPAAADPTRVASQIVVGIGFLGGGVILRHRGEVRGLTTAAGLWVTAAVGLSVALGFWTGAGVAVGLALISLLIKPAEKAIRPSDGGSAGDDEEDDEEDGGGNDRRSPKGWPEP